LWSCSEIGRLELMRATYIDQRFARHAHARFALGVIEAGALGFHYRGENVVASAGVINLANPDEPHTGHAASEKGWTYRMFYFDAEHLRDAASQITDRPCSVPRFDAGVIHDPNLAGQIQIFHQTMENGHVSRLEAQTRFMAILVALIERHADTCFNQRAVGRETQAIKRARDYIHAHFAEDIPIDHLSSLACLSPFHFAHAFTQQVGLPPHTYLIQTRVRQARAMLRSGHKAAATALATGFFDQSHLNRHFKRLTGMTPARYRRIVQENP